MVLSVNELTADTAIADISRELEKLRRTAHALRMPIANSIDLIETFCSMYLAVNLLLICARHFFLELCALYQLAALAIENITQLTH